MIHIFICPKCEEIRMVSRHRSASCLNCGEAMIMSEIPYLRWTQLDEEERSRAAARQAASFRSQMKSVGKRPAG